MNKDAVQNERQPRNTATIRPEALINSEESERMLRDGVAATVTAVFNPNQSNKREWANRIFVVVVLESSNKFSPIWTPHEAIQSAIQIFHQTVLNLSTTGDTQPYQVHTPF